MKALLKVDEEYQHLRHLKDHLVAENGLRNVSNFKFLAWIFSILAMFPSLA